MKLENEDKQRHANGAADRYPDFAAGDKCSRQRKLKMVNPEG
jgi:hypothetical protein